MGKKYVVMEVSEDVLKKMGVWDYTPLYITEKDVIDENALRKRLQRIITSDQEGWALPKYVKEAVSLILDPPRKPDLEGDKWEKWVDDCPILKNEGMNEVLKNWLRKMPKEK